MRRLGNLGSGKALHKTQTYTQKHTDTHECILTIDAPVGDLGLGLLANAEKRTATHVICNGIKRVHEIAPQR